MRKLTNGHVRRFARKAEHARANAMRFNFDGTLSRKSLRRAMKWWRKMNHLVERSIGLKPLVEPRLSLDVTRRLKAQRILERKKEFSGIVPEKQ